MPETQTYKDIDEVTQLSKQILDKLTEIKDEEKVLNLAQTKSLNRIQNQTMDLFDSLFKLRSKLWINEFKKQQKKSVPEQQKKLKKNKEIIL